MKKFVEFLLKSVYKSKPIDSSLIALALNKTFKDVKFHYPNLTTEEVQKRIENNSNELAVFLFRLGQLCHENNLEDLKPQIHWLLKQYCSCEIYFNNEIGEGFYVVHGQGTVIGSRNTIGEGFIIHQGCTIGHKKNGSGAGTSIGNHVTIYANSSIIGELSIGSNVVIGAHILVTKDIPNNTIVTVKNNQN